MNPSRTGKTQSTGDTIPGLQETFDAVVQICQEKGINFFSAANEWALTRRSELESMVAPNFDSLCLDGCHPIGLAGALFLAKYAPMISFFVRGLLGEVGDRPRYARKLREAAKILNKLAEPTFEGFEQRIRTRKPELPVGPGKLAQSLEVYAKFFEIAESLSRNSGIKSRYDLPRFIVSDYVHRTSGRWHDREVSTLLQSDGTDVYDETAHRVWRNRNFRRLGRQFAFLSDLLFAIGQLFANHAAIERE